MPKRRAYCGLESPAPYPGGLQPCALPSCGGIWRWATSPIVLVLDLLCTRRALARLALSITALITKSKIAHTFDQKTRTRTRARTIRDAALRICERCRIFTSMPTTQACGRSGPSPSGTNRISSNSPRYSHRNRTPVLRRTV